MTSGVPHGSVLILLPFLIYIYNLENTTLSLCRRNYIILWFEIHAWREDTFCFELQIGKQLLSSSNKLSLNGSETKYVFHVNHKKDAYPDLIINNYIIEREVNFNFVRLLSTDNATINCHIDHVSRKISRIIGVIRVMKMTFPFSSFRNVV